MIRSLMSIPMLGIAVFILLWNIAITIVRAFYWSAQDVWGYCSTNIARKTVDTFAVWWAYANNRDLPTPKKCNNPDCFNCGNK